MNNVGITLDVDWCPDYMIDYVIDKFISANVKSTWFITHNSPAVERLRQHPALFEIGIHPNFLPNSTHGKTEKEVLAHCMSLEPAARSIRTHSLVQSTPLLARILKETSMKIDVSLFLPYANNIEPVEFFWEGKGLLRIPFYWEDDYEMEQVAPRWNIDSRICSGNGLRIFNFHPMHIFLNSPDMSIYRSFKKQVGDFTKSKENEALDFVFKGKGTTTFFDELLHYLSPKGNASNLGDIYNEWNHLKKS